MEIASRGLTLGRRIRHMGRLAQITNVFARHGMWSLAERLGLRQQLSPEQVKEAESLSSDAGSTGAGANGETDVMSEQGTPARLRRAFEELGPAFVKLGQVLAVREDILPAPFIEELRKLHQKVTPLPFSTISQVLAAELGSDRLALIANVDEQPLAAGSIAQVHVATLKGGASVVVKVQRPGIDQQIRVDLSLMEELAQLLERFIPETASARPAAMVREFSRALLGELDFVREGGNIAKITKNFSSTSDIVIPVVHWPLTTHRVLTMSRLNGLPAWDREKIKTAGHNAPLLVERGFGMFLKMVFVDGLYHGDLHPGNILAMAGDRVGVIDFGLCVHVSKAIRENLAGLLVGLVEEDFHRAVMHYVELADLAPTFDVDAFEHDVGNAVAPFIGLRLAELRSGRLFWDLARVAARHGAPMPHALVIFVKTLVTFEGIGTNLDPSFDVLTAAEKFSASLAASIHSPENLRREALTVGRDFLQLLKHAPLQTRRLLKTILQGDLSLTVHSPELERLATAVDRSSSRLSISAIIAALIIASSIVAASKSNESFASIPAVGLVGFAMAGILGLYVVWSILRGR